MLEARTQNTYGLEQPRDNLRYTVKSKIQTSFQKSEVLFGEREGVPTVLKFPGSRDNANREWEGLTIARNHGIRVPTPFVLLERDQEPTLGIAMEWVQGELLADNPTQNAKFKVGQEVKKLHSIKLPGFGIQRDGKPTFDSREKFLDHWINLTVPYLPEAGEASTILTTLHQTVARNKDVEPTFLHRDVNNDNVIVTPDKNIVLFDFEWWQGGDPMDDIGGQLYHSIRTDEPHGNFQSFLDGYFENDAMHKEDVEAMLFYAMLAGSKFVSFCARTNPSRMTEALASLGKTVAFIKPRL